MIAVYLWGLSSLFGNSQNSILPALLTNFRYTSRELQKLHPRITTAEPHIIQATINSSSPILRQNKRQARVAIGVGEPFTVYET